MTAAITVTVVGCSGSFPGPDSAASCYLVESDDPAGRTWRVLLDLGNGALGALQRYADPLGIDAVLLTHLHPDHCLDLCGYYVMRKFHPDGPRPRIPVWGPEGTAARMAQAYGLPDDPGMTEEFSFRSWGGPVVIGPLTITPVPVVHPVDAYGLRVSAYGATVAYTGDTGATPVLDDLARDADLLLAEASFLDGTPAEAGIHLTGTDCGGVARRAGVKRLVLTHIPPWHDPGQALAEARAVYRGPAGLARPGAVYQVG